jgi:hypothetical protein
MNSLKNRLIGIEIFTEQIVSLSLSIKAMINGLKNRFKVIRKSISSTFDLVH